MHDFAVFWFLVFGFSALFLFAVLGLPLFSALLFLCLVEVAVGPDQPFKAGLALISHFNLDVSSSLVS